MNVDIGSILKSKLFKKLLGQSKFVLGKKGRILGVAIQLLEKLSRTTSIALLGSEIIGKFKILAALIYHYAKGNYTDISKKS